MTCEKCSGKFRIPGGKPPSGHSDNDIRVACPKCGKLLRYDVSVRGRQVTCDKCDAVFKIPDRKDHAA
jgi:RNase P subunit RPR2